MDFETAIEQTKHFLDLNKHCVLATSSSDGVLSTSTVCFVRDGLSVYFQTDSSFEKIQNIKQNQNVAFSVGSYNFKGVAQILGHPANFPNFIERLLLKDKKTYDLYTNLKNEVLVKIDLTEIKIWHVENTKNAKNNEKILKINLKTKNVTEIICDKL